ncbi:hypothetical protein EON81_02635 [bacterium]|nr:MAG: hypothetical protein EON81_02635 [bacterium]
MYRSAEIQPLFRFGYAMALLGALRMMVGLVSIPRASLEAASIVISVIFVIVPIAAIFMAAAYRWERQSAMVAIGVGVACQFLLGLAVKNAPDPLSAGFLMAGSQIGLISWCLGVGALLVSALKDKNMILPIAIFLGLFDIWLVFVPEGIAGQVARGNQEPLKRIAYSVPAPAAESQGGQAVSMLYIGPADFLFMAMFFVALYRFKMRTRATAIAMLPTMAAYLLVVLVFSDKSIGPIRLGALPALVPIGMVVLGVNWREFKLTKDEKLTTVVLFIIGIALLAWRFWVNREAM